MRGPILQLILPPHPLACRAGDRLLDRHVIQAGPAGDFTSVCSTQSEPVLHGMAIKNRSRRASLDLQPLDLTRSQKPRSPSPWELAGTRCRTFAMHPRQAADLQNRRPVGVGQRQPEPKPARADLDQLRGFVLAGCQSPRIARLPIQRTHQLEELLRPSRQVCDVVRCRLRIAVRLFGQMKVTPLNADHLATELILKPRVAVQCVDGKRHAFRQQVASNSQH